MEVNKNMETEKFLAYRKTAVLARDRARSERHVREAEELKKEFLRKLDQAQALHQEAISVQSEVKGAEAESQRSHLITMLSMF